MSEKQNSNGDEIPAATPSKLGRIHKRIHKEHETERAIADTAKERRIKAKQDRAEKKGKGKK